jgi:hypothetical protein
MTSTKYPFEVPYAEIEVDPTPFIDAVVNTLESSFMVLPRGPGFVSYPRFQKAYEVLKRHTSGFATIDPDVVVNAVEEDALVFVILRTMLGLTAPELAYTASQRSGLAISQGYARNFDRRVRDNQHALDTITETGRERVTAMISTACALLTKGAPTSSPDMIHRLDKADTSSGIDSIRHVAQEDVPYAMLLYERFLGRPFAGHRDSVSRLVGEVMESAVKDRLREAGISFRETRYAERIEGFDQAPDFIIPDEWNPRVVIEAKITEDDGTARDKVTRIQHLAEIARQRGLQGESGFEVIACIDGRGFSVRREDMRKLLEATQGKVFTLETLNQIVENTSLKTFTSK